MENPRKTKPCPFCGEMILADAVKCRYCKEFLTEDEDSLPVSHHAAGLRRPIRPAPSETPAAQKTDSGPACTTPMRVVPSLWGMAGTFLSGLLIAAVGIALMILFEEYVGEQTAAQESVRLACKAAHWAGALFVVVALMKILYKALYLKSILYQITPDRIEWNRGVFNRKVDNLDMFRVIDIKLHRSLLDRLLGIGKVTLMTQDKTDPVFEFEKVRRPRELYDYIKSASLVADRKHGVVHLE